MKNYNKGFIALLTPGIFISLASIFVITLLQIQAIYSGLLSSGEILVAYWLETEIICLFTILKIKKATLWGEGELNFKINGNPLPQTKESVIKAVYVIAIMLLFYVPFIFVYLLADIDAPGFKINEPFSVFILHTASLTLILFVNHLISYFSNYIWGGEYLTAKVVDLYKIPLKRTMFIHIVILFGPLFSIPGVLFVGLKGIADVIGHLSERLSIKQSPNDPEADY